MREKDPVGAAMTRGFSTQNPIQTISDFSPDKFVEAMTVRAPQASAVSNAYGTQYRPLMDSEAKNLKSTIDKMPPKDLANWMTTVSSGVTDKDALKAVFRQIAPNDRSLVAASDILVSTTAKPEKIRSDADAILFGRNIMGSVPKGQGAEQEKGFSKAALPTPADIGNEISRYAGMLNVPEGVLDTYREAIMAHYIGTGRAQNSNADLSLGDKDLKQANISLLHKSIDAVMGMKEGGFVGTKSGSTVVLRPYGMDGSTFQNSVQKQVDSIYDGKYRWGEYSLTHAPNGIGYLVNVAGKEPVYIDPTKDIYSDNSRGITKSEQQRRIEDYQKRGFFGNVMEAFTGGSLNRGGDINKTIDYGLRNDGTKKGSGWLGELQLPNGGVATEYTMQSEAVKQNGKMIDFPTLVPTLTKEERDLMVNDIIPNRKELPESIIQKAIDHANMRLKNGKSVFKEH
jgi:hypothetical protein